jgi:16S rRNA G527 N7-methylase RsmG
LKSNEINVELTEDQLENLKEFLSYLEKKNIINITQLEHDPNQLNNLIQDIMKLDLTKFSQQNKEMKE